MRRWLLSFVCLAGCNQVYGLDETRLPTDENDEDIDARTTPTTTARASPTRTRPTPMVTMSTSPGPHAIYTVGNAAQLHYVVVYTSD